LDLSDSKGVVEFSRKFVESGTQLNVLVSSNLFQNIVIFHEMDLNNFISEKFVLINRSTMQAV
jgi:hypothetical protein